MGNSSSTAGFCRFPDGESVNKIELAGYVLAHEREDPGIHSLTGEDSGAATELMKLDVVAKILIMQDRGLLIWLKDDKDWTDGCGQSVSWRIRSSLATFLGVNIFDIELIVDF